MLGLEILGVEVKDAGLVEDAHDAVGDGPVVAVAAEVLDVVFLSADEVEELVGLHVDQDADELAEIPAKDGCQFFFRVEEVE